MRKGIEATIGRRFTALVAEGEKLLDGWEGDGTIDVSDRPACLAWLLSSVNLLEVAMPLGSRYRQEAQRLLPKADENIWSAKMASILGILKSAESEWRNGLVGTLELQFVGIAFEDFLKHAAEYTNQGRKMEASILASAVLEDTVKRLCRKHSIATDNKGLDALVNALKAAQVLGKVKAERLRSSVALRNKAFHADWDAFDERDLRQMIEGLEELLEAHFA